jgi:micrococcal nuclease
VLAAGVVGGGGAPPDEAVVRRVIDGDTIELSDGRLVRYLGIDAPEVRRKVGDQWVVDPEPFGLAATEANRQLVERRRVRLEYDAQRRDRYGRVLAYVYVEDRMVNEALVEAGYAQPMTIPPNVRYADRFRILAREARRAGRGLWGRQ